MRAALEFRHLSWFDDEVYAHLHKHNAAFCIAESSELTTPWIVTSDFGYLRLRREDYKNPDLVQWAEADQAQKDRWSDVFVYFKHEETGVGPRFASRMMNLLET